RVGKCRKCSNGTSSLGRQHDGQRSSVDMTAPFLHEALGLQSGEAVGGGGWWDSQFLRDSRQRQAFAPRGQQLEDLALGGSQTLRRPLIPRTGVGKLGQSPKRARQSLLQGNRNPVKGKHMTSSLGALIWTVKPVLRYFAGDNGRSRLVRRTILLPRWQGMRGRAKVGVG